MTMKRLFYSILLVFPAIMALTTGCVKPAEPVSDNPNTPAQTPEQRNVTCSWFSGSYMGNGRYILRMSDKTPLGDGTWAAQSVTCILEVLDEKPYDPDAALLKEGSYELGTGTSSISATQSLLVTTTKNGTVFGEYLFERARLTVTADGLRLEGQTNDGLECLLTYTGALSYENVSEDPHPLYPVTEHIKATFTEAAATYYTTDANGVSNFLLSFTDMARNQDDQLVPPGNLFSIDLYGVLTEDHALDGGTFSMDTQYTHAAGTYTGGHILDYYGTLIPGGAYLTTARVEEGEVTLRYGIVTGGTATITRQGQSYTVALDMEMDGGYSLKATYTGPIPVTDRYPEEGDDEDDDTEEPLSTLTEDYTLNFSGSTEAEARYFGPYYSELTDNWILWIMPTGGNLAGRDALHIELCTEHAGYEAGIPEGHFTIDMEKIYHPGYLIPGYYSEGYSATYFLTLADDGRSMAQHAPAWGGYLDITRSGSNYTISFDLTDDATPAHHFKGSWTGPMKMSDHSES